MPDRRNLYWIPVCVALQAGLFPNPGVSAPVVPIARIVVEENGIGPKAEGCSSFAMTEKTARAFFDKAILISGRQQHDYFLHGPCSARGTFQSRYGTWKWEIRNLGTATITATDGAVFLLADPDQESSLADG